MKKAWKIVIAIVLIAILLGIVSIGVGILTGADMVRITAIADEQVKGSLGGVSIEQYVDWLGQAFYEVFSSPTA